MSTATLALRTADQTNATLSTRARCALAILSIDAINPAADEALAAMCEAREAAFRADLRAKEAEALADAAPAQSFTRAAESARHAADAAEANAQRTYAKHGGVVRRREALTRTLDALIATRNENARVNDYVCTQRSLDAQRDAHLWA